MPATVREVCTGALRLIGVTQRGSAPSAEDMQVAVYSLRSMLESWSTESLQVFYTTTLEFDFIPGKAEYSLGPTGDWISERPMSLSYAYLRYATGSGAPIDQQMQILNDAQRASITAKSIQSPIPTTVYYNPEWPDAKLTFWPVPSATYKAILWLDMPLTEFVDLSDELQFPRGYEQAIRYNLAVNLAPEFGRDDKLTPAVIDTAARSKTKLKVINTTPRYLMCTDYSQNPSRQRGPSPILTGLF